ncbi:MAG TPA: SOS response-associated peptidase family protein [Edaphocola sp.]|nr:SOS response-associated peptidase family protein [Edaphocola sp.]
MKILFNFVHKMCYHVSFSSKKASISQALGFDFSEDDNKIPKGIFNAFDFPTLAIITNDPTQRLQLAEWGLVPSFTSNNFNRVNTLNARIEHIQEKISFKNSLSNRCIIPISSFFEWKWLDGKGKQKQKFEIKGVHEILLLAGIFSNMGNQLSFTIITTPANELMSEIHNIKKRMPLILTDDNKNKWLQGDDVKLFEHCDPDLNAQALDFPKQQPTLF